MSKNATNNPFGQKAAAPQEEAKIAFSGAAVLANKFYVTLNKSGVRIAFAEAYSKDEEPIFRTAVVLPIVDAVGLYKLLQEVLKVPEEQIGKLIQEAQQKKEQETQEEEVKNG